MSRRGGHLRLVRPDERAPVSAAGDPAEFWSALAERFRELATEAEQWERYAREQTRPTG